MQRMELMERSFVLEPPDSLKDQLFFPLTNCVLLSVCTAAARSVFQFPALLNRLFIRGLPSAVAFGVSIDDATHVVCRDTSILVSSVRVPAFRQ